MTFKNYALYDLRFMTKWAMVKYILVDKWMLA